MRTFAVTIVLMASITVSSNCETQIDHREGNHALVVFKDERSAVVPKERVTNVEDSGMCDVRWTNRKIYKAKLFMWGTKEECEEKQDSIDQEQGRVEEEGVMERVEEEEVMKTDDKENHSDYTNTRVRVPKKRKPINEQPKGKKANKSKQYHYRTTIKYVKRKRNEQKKDDFMIEVGHAPKRIGPSKAVSNTELIKSPEQQQIKDFLCDSDNSEHEFSSESSQSGKKWRKFVSVLGQPKHCTGKEKSHGCCCEQFYTAVADMDEKYDHLKEQVHGMQKLINSLFILGAKSAPLTQTTPTMPPLTQTTSTRPPVLQTTPTMLPSLETSPTIMQSGDLGTSSDTIFASQSSQATSLIACGPSSGDETLSLPTSDTISLSGGTTSDKDLDATATDGLISTDEGRKSPDNSTLPSCLSVPPVGANVEVSLLPPSELMQLYQKSCSRMNFAAKLSEKLFDEETRMTHNVSGRNKPKLDPVVVAFIKEQCFEFFPCKSTERVDVEWPHCVTAIDEKNRRLKKNKKVT